MKILITGVAGFIGFHLSSYLVKRGDEVIGLDSINDYYDISLKYGRLNVVGIEQQKIEYNQLTQSTQHQNYQFIKLQLEDRENLNQLFAKEKFDAVCHLAAQAGVRYSIDNPMAYIDANIVGFINILEACRHYNVKNLNYASSSSVYGLNKKTPFSTTDNVDHPVSLYAASKKSNELMAHTYSHLYGIATTGLRFFTVYGPWGRPDMSYFLFTKAALENKAIKVFNHGNMQRDFTYIDDIIEVVARSIDNPAKADPNWSSDHPSPCSSSVPYKVYNIGNNKPIKLMAFIETIENILGKKIKKKMLPMQAGDVHTTYADINDLNNDFNYYPNTTIQTGIEHFIHWYKNFYYREK